MALPSSSTPSCCGMVRLDLHLGHFSRGSSISSRDAEVPVKIARPIYTASCTNTGINWRGFDVYLDCHAVWCDYRYLVG